MTVSTHPIPHKRLGQVLRLIAVLAFLSWSAIFIARSSFLGPDGRRYYSLFDDAMISMRYAWNASHGLGLVWNPGERVEGYTNLLMTLIMTVATAVFDRRIAVLAIQILGVPTAIAVALATDRLTRALGGDQTEPWADFVGAVAFTFTLAYYPLLYWSLMGMETGLVTVLSTWALVVALRPRPSPRASIVVAILLALAYLARPDSAVLALPILGFLAFRAYSVEGKGGLRTVLTPLAIFGITIIGVEIFRFIYYGDLVPNTYRLKIEGYPLADRLQNGVLFVRGFVRETWPLAAILWISCLFAWSKEKGLALLVAGMVLGYQIWAGGDAWDYWRMLVPMVPILIAAFESEAAAILRQLAPALGAVWQTLAERRPLGPQARIDSTRGGNTSKLILVAGSVGLVGLIAIPLARWAGIGSPDLGPRKLAALAGALALASLLLPTGRAFIRSAILKAGVPLGLVIISLSALWQANSQFLPEITFERPALQVVNNGGNLRTAWALQAVTDNSATVGVSWAGLIPYYTGRPAVDFLGKSDKTIASLAPDLSGSLHEEGMSTMPGHNKYDLVYSIETLRPTYVQDCKWARQDLCSWVDEHYARVDFGGVSLLLLRGSPDVLWSAIGAP